MRLGEALQIAAKATGEKKVGVHLLCGFTPLHLETFVKAYLAQRFPNATPAVSTGLFGDLVGNIRRSREKGGDGAIVVIEWSDLDQRLGLRASAGWSLQTLDDIVIQVEQRCRVLEQRMADLAEAMPVALVAPTLGLPPLTLSPPGQTSVHELQLNAMLAEFLQRVCGHKEIRLVSDAYLAIRSPYAGRHDVKMDLNAGFPYAMAHADTLAELAMGCLFPPAPKKGLITDLDQTLWKGILGDAGVDGVSWSLESKSQAHALYQQVLASLAESGVLVAVASKNDPGFVAAAFERPDILLQSSQVFPFEVSWGLKSEAVGSILKVWNIGAESVVFVDDSPMELAEVAEKYPGMQCLQFPSDDPAAIIALLWQLRAKFGKSEVLEEDRLRLLSIRSSAVRREENVAEASADFLSRAEAKITLEASAGSDHRAFELVNKTNQFNLNGARYTEAEWRSLLLRPGAFLATLSYEDRFGPLGRIAVLGGYRNKDVCYVDIWVMSCRAFSRQIEFQSIRQLFDKTGASEIQFQFKPTDRNGPFQTFFAHFFDRGLSGEGELHLQSKDFDRLCPVLFHQVNDKWTMLEKN
ncbi:MAG: HAD-IIIC family phosphatase [Bryobacteraceae bacterium]